MGESSDVSHTTTRLCSAMYLCTDHILYFHFLPSSFCVRYLCEFVIQSMTTTFMIRARCRLSAHAFVWCPGGPSEVSIAPLSPCSMSPTNAVQRFHQSGPLQGRYKYVATLPDIQIMVLSCCSLQFRLIEHKPYPALPTFAAV